MINTQHLPGIGPDISQADLAGEQFRARLGQPKPKPSTELVWVEGHQITAEQWEAFKSDRFWAWHSEGVACLSLEAWLKR